MIKDRKEFQKKLQAFLAEYSPGMGEEQIRNYFAEEALTEDQLNLIMKYVRDDAHPESTLSREEEDYLADYREMIADTCQDREGRLRLIERVAAGDEQAAEELICASMGLVTEIAVQLHRPGVLLEDLIQEGNMGLMLGVRSLSDPEEGEAVIETAVRREIQRFLLETESLTHGEHKMVARVNALNESLTKLEHELSRKVYLEEIAEDMGISEEAVKDILKLTGEMPETSEDDTN